MRAFGRRSSTRGSPGLSTIAKGVPDLPLELLQGATMRGIDVGATAVGLEKLLLEAADANRHGSAYTTSGTAHPARTESLQVTGGPDPHLTSVRRPRAQRRATP